jgi:hypothetical protein
LFQLICCSDLIDPLKSCRKVIKVLKFTDLGHTWDMELVIVAVAILVILLVAKNGSSKRK